LSDLSSWYGQVKFLSCNSHFRLSIPAYPATSGTACRQNLHKISNKYIKICNRDIDSIIAIQKANAGGGHLAWIRIRPLSDARRWRCCADRVSSRQEGCAGMCRDADDASGSACGTAIEIGVRVGAADATIDGIWFEAISYQAGGKALSPMRRAEVSASSAGVRPGCSVASGIRSGRIRMRESERGAGLAAVSLSSPTFPPVSPSASGERSWSRRRLCRTRRCRCRRHTCASPRRPRMSG